MQSVKTISQPHTANTTSSAFFSLGGLPSQASFFEQMQIKQKQNYGQEGTTNGVMRNDQQVNVPLTKVNGPVMMKRRKQSPITLQGILEKEKGYKTHEHSRIDLVSKTNPKTPQDTQIEDQDEKPISKDSLELPNIQPVKKSNPRAKPQKKENCTTGIPMTFQKSFMEKVTAKQFQTRLQPRDAQSLLSTNLIRTEEKNFLNCYWFDYFNDMRMRETFSMCDNSLINHSETTKYLRANFVDWVFHVHQCLEKSDTTIPYLALNMMDRYYQQQSIAQKPLDLQLNGVTCLFIISKVYEVVPIDMCQIINDMCFQKYSDEQFLERETEIMNILGCIVDAPHTLEFLLFYYKLLRFYVQELMRSNLSHQVAAYLDKSEHYAQLYLRATLTDLVLISVKPSIIAGTAMLFGLSTSYRMLLKAQQNGESPSFGESEIKTVTFAWNEIAKKLFDEATTQELEEFMEEISERLTYINQKYGQRLEHIYVKELQQVLPKYSESFNDKYFDII